MKTIKMILLITLSVLMIFSLVSCSLFTKSLDGEYRNEGLISGTLIFSGDNVTISAFGIDATGTYEVKDDEIIFKYSIFGSEQTLKKSFSRIDKGIIIGGLLFNKVDD